MTAAVTRRGAAIELRGASAIVAGRTVWSGVDLTLQPGAFAALLGPNGAGKSTLLRCLLGLHRLEGTARVLGREPGASNDRIGYLPQRRSFDPALNVRGVDIVGLGLDGDRWGFGLPLGARARERRDRIARVIGQVGADSYAHRPVGACSGGEQQRLLIAQALLRRPQLLVLDEPLDSLDVPHQAAISALLRDIARDDGIAILLVAHDINPLLGHLDQVVYLGNGTAVQGPPDEVITAQTLTALYGTPVDVLRDRRGRLVVVGQPDHRGHCA